MSEARKGVLLLRRVLHQQGIAVPCTANLSQVDTPFASLDVESEAMLQAVLDAVSAATPFPHIPSEPYLPGHLDVQHAGGSFIQGCMTDVRVAGVMQHPFPCVISGGTHWSQWMNVLARLQH